MATMDEASFERNNEESGEIPMKKDNYPEAASADTSADDVLNNGFFSLEDEVSYPLGNHFRNYATGSMAASDAMGGSDCDRSIHSASDASVEVTRRDDEEMDQIISIANCDDDNDDKDSIGTGSFHSAVNGDDDDPPPATTTTAADLSASSSKWQQMESKMKEWEEGEKNDVDTSPSNLNSDSTATPTMGEKDIEKKDTNEETVESSSNDNSSGISIEEEAVDDSKSNLFADTFCANKKKLVCRLSILFVLLVVVIILGVSLSGNSDEDQDNLTSSSNLNSGGDIDAEEEQLTPTGAPTMFGTGAPTVTRAPTSSPTTATPTTSPSASPTGTPTSQPSNTPTGKPSSLTSAPTTLSPTNSPTTFFVPPNPVPQEPPLGYFNYDMDDALYGPNNWQNVDTSGHWLREFTENGFGTYQGYFDGLNPTRNRCDASMWVQSPIHLDGNTRCTATHEIRSWCGSRGIGFEEYQRLILPHKLSLVMNRRRCLNTGNDNCATRRPPLVDYPDYSANSRQQFSDLLNVDIKVPAEHSFDNLTFDAEIQMFHTHLDDDPVRVSSLALPIRATPDGHNGEFQQLLDVFQSKYDNDARRCNATQQRRRNLRKEAVIADGTLATVALEEKEVRRVLQNNVPQSEKFNPYSEAFMPGSFFYRYDGSMTEPPCMGLTWFVMMEPMIISFEQLQQVKEVLFTHEDQNCTRTSAHNGDQSVARPQFPVSGAVQICAPGSFRTDLERDKEEPNKCN